MNSPGEKFKKALAKAIRRIPSEKETLEAFRRFRELEEVLEDIRLGRNGMRHEDVPPAEERPRASAENA